MRLDNISATDMLTIVSIHASVKDATNIKADTSKKEGVSIHASVKDATGALAVLFDKMVFQSTHL